MTRTKTFVLTGLAAILYILLGWIFADGLFSLDHLIGEDFYSESTIITYALLGLIILAGLLQARSIPPEGVKLDEEPHATAPGATDDPKLWKRLLGNAYWSIIWMPVRFFVGLQWLQAGEHKVRSDAWMDGGSALQGYWERAVAVPDAPAQPAISYAWYRDFLQYMLDREWYEWFAPMIAVGEVLIGVGLIVGALVGIAAFFGTVMNFNFMLAGSASSNPVLFGLTVFLVLAWKVAGYWGIDRYLLPTLGAPWKAGTLITERRVSVMAQGETTAA